MRAGRFRSTRSWRWATRVREDLGGDVGEARVVDQAPLAAATSYPRAKGRSQIRKDLCIFWLAPMQPPRSRPQ
jgi:hypothetical protein